MTGSIVTPDLRARVRGLALPVARGLGRLGLTPNHLTLIGFGIAIVAAGAAAAGAWLAAGILVIVGGVFDLFDGALARSRGQATRLGAFFDSVFDRWGEGVVYIGIAWGCARADFLEGSVLATAALASSFMVSYARAKSESLGFTPGTRMAAIGLAPREVRIVIVTLALLVAGGAGSVTVGSEPCFLPGGAVCPITLSTGALGLAIGLGLIAVLATITTIQRILHVVRQARED
ncbi:MAG TPA: CDP-alcohol phosphatidyltransferase family protein [Candidatus Limnocylindrales bacterium]|nr:CDP-alcohol phosphatidyltransferase family protein [Candidatus Limnocylindrales bacterium]